MSFCLNRFRCELRDQCRMTLCYQTLIGNITTGFVMKSDVSYHRMNMKHDDKNDPMITFTFYNVMQIVISLTYESFACNRSIFRCFALVTL